MAVLALVRGVESLRQPGRPVVVELAARDVEADLIALADVPAVGETPHDPPVVRDAVSLELRRGLCRQLVEACAETFAVERLQEVALGGDELVLEVGGEQPGRGRDPRMGRDEHPRDLELDRDVAGEQRARAAGGDERELARVVAAPHGVDLDRLRHRELLNLERPERRLLDGHAEPIRDPLHRGRRELDVE